jgi:anti-sigma regulatory factor (Ser/Thr protein kinase)
MGKKAPNTQSITLHNRLSDSSKLFDFLTQCVETIKVPDETYNDLRLILEEAFVNIVSYAYEEKETQSITVALTNTADEICITFKDNGVAFNPLAVTAACTETDDHSEGGMGIHIIKSLSDNQEYNRVGQSNVFTVTKHYTR